MLPVMRYRNTESRYVITTFGGLNTSFSQSVNELTEAKNMSSEIFPALCSAQKIESVQSTDNIICTAGFFDKLYTVERTDAPSGSVYLKSEGVDKEIATFENPSENHIIEFLKDSALIIPENMIYHIKDDKLQKGDVSVTSTQALCKERFKKQSGTDKDMPMPYNTWYSAELKHNSITAISANYSVSSTSYKFYHLSLPNDFEKGDVVTIKMEVKPTNVDKDSAYYDYLEKMANGISVKIKEVVKTRHATPSGTISEITALTFDDYAIDMGGYDDVVVLDVTVEKSIPEFIDICSYENRMWGITKDELCASKLGDASEWNDFTVDSYGTLPSSSFATGVESDGSFTAVTAYNGNVLAFKEDCIYKVYGNEPNEYSLTRINCPGVKKGCHTSLATVNGALYYMSKGGIYCFNGSSAVHISVNLDMSGLSSGSASGDERFYYINMYSDTKNLLYIFDTLRGVWHITDCPPDLKTIVPTDGKIAFVCEKEIMQKSESFCDKWNFALSFAKKEFASKHVCGILLRYYLDEGASFSVKLKNKHGTYVLSETKDSAENKPLSVDIPITCGEDADLIFEGSGKFVLTSLTLRYKETSIKN